MTEREPVTREHHGSHCRCDRNRQDQPDRADERMNHLDGDKFDVERAAERELAE